MTAPLSVRGADTVRRHTLGRALRSLRGPTAALIVSPSTFEHKTFFYRSYRVPQTPDNDCSAFPCSPGPPARSQRAAPTCLSAYKTHSLLDLDTGSHVGVGREGEPRPPHGRARRGPPEFTQNSDPNSDARRRPAAALAASCPGEEQTPAAPGSPSPPAKLELMAAAHAHTLTRPGCPHPLPTTCPLPAQKTQNSPPGAPGAGRRRQVV